MKKIAKFLNKISFLLIPIIITVLMLGLRLVHFSSVDDMYILYIAESLKTNAHSEHLFFVSVILGYLFKGLYMLTPVINWFCVGEIFAATLAFIAMHRIVKTGGGSIIATSILMMLQVVFLNSITYTGIAFTLPIVGGIWILTYVDDLSKESIKHFVLAFFMMFLGFSFRMGKTFYCVIIIVLSLVYIGLKSKRTTFSVVALLLVFCVVANYSVMGIEKIYQMQHPEPTLYYEFQKNRATAYDVPLPDFEKNEEALRAVGISENDLKLMHFALYGDANVFSPEAMKAISDCNGFEERYEKNPLKLIMDFVTSQIVVVNVFIVFLLLAVLALIFSKGKRMEVLAVILAISANVAFLFFRKRGLPRVYNPIAMAGVFIIVYFFIQEKATIIELAMNTFKKIDIKKTTIALFLIVAIAFSGVSVFNTEFRILKTENVRTYLQNDEEHTYLAHSWARNYMHDRNLSVLRKNFMDIPVVVSMGEWYIYSNYWNDYHRNNGLEDYTETPYFALLEENVYYLTEYADQADMIETFFEENYQMDVDYQEVDAVPDDNNVTKYHIYDFYVADQQ